MMSASGTRSAATVVVNCSCIGGLSRVLGVEGYVLASGASGSSAVRGKGRRATQGFSGAALLLAAPVENHVGEVADLAADVVAEGLEGHDGGDRHERGGDGVLGKFQAGFIAEESLEHFRFAPSFVRLGL